MKYELLEPKITSELNPVGQSLSFSTNQPLSFYASTTFIWGVFFVAIVTFAFVRFVLASGLRMQGTPTSISKSNEIFKTVTLGLLGVFSLFLILYTFNKDLLIGDVGLGELGIKNTGSYSAPKADERATPGNISVAPSGSSKACAATNEVISSLTSAGGICASTRCTKLAGCTYQQYLPIIKEESASASVDYKIVVAIMCRESDGRENPPQRTGIDRNSDNSSDCGLMQINVKSTSCPDSVLDPRSNIREGVKKIKAALGRSGQIYKNISPTTNAFADYNCCSNGDIPSSPSNDCTVASGFPFTPPKWACPINPGTDRYNMCAVKNYACEITKCAEEVP